MVQINRKAICDWTKKMPPCTAQIRQAVVVAGKSAASQDHRACHFGRPGRSDALKGRTIECRADGLLKAWIDQGAVWPDEKKHWSFSKPVRPELPVVKKQALAANEIDAFILARMEQEIFSPSPEADGPHLIRRLSLDLTGLPPTIAEVDAYLNDRSGQAYEKLIDRLLASPHCGEHLTRGWLDLARYADSNGYQVDLARFDVAVPGMGHQRVQPEHAFDQFTIEQLAGDLLPNTTLEQKVATGFHRNTKFQRRGRRR